MKLHICKTSTSIDILCKYTIAPIFCSYFSELTADLNFITDGTNPFFSVNSYIIDELTEEDIIYLTLTDDYYTIDSENVSIDIAVTDIIYSKISGLQ